MLKKQKETEFPASFKAYFMGMNAQLTFTSCTMQNGIT